MTDDTIWLEVLIKESIVIVIINAFTLIVFARNRQLRKRSTYLIINLTVADLLVGAVTVPLEIYYLQADYGSGWQAYSISIAYNVFQLASLVNLCLLSLERLHATLNPLKHYLLIQERFYFKSIICSWFLALLLASVNAVLYVYTRSGGYDYLWVSFIVVTLLTLTVSYVIIFVKIKSSPPPHPGGAVASDRKLSITLFIVTVVSTVTILPYAIYVVILFHMWNELSLAIQFYITLSAYALYYACSIVNPVIYAIRMQEFRKAMYRQLLCGRSTNSNRVHPIELHAM